MMDENGTQVPIAQLARGTEFKILKVWVRIPLGARNNKIEKKVNCMDAFFIVALIALALALVFGLLSRTFANVRNKLGAKFFGWCFLAVGVTFFVTSCFVIVGTNKIAIFTETGAAYTAENNGFEWKRPWGIKTEFDASKQFLRFCGTGNNAEDPDDKEFPQINVKIDGNAKADVCGTIAWQMKAGTPEEKLNAIQLFKDYKQFERVTKHLVYPSVAKTLGIVLKNHNPLVEEKNMSIADMNDDLLSALKPEFGNSIFIISVDVRIPDKGYDDITDNAIAESLAQKAKTQIAKEKELTNKAESAANAAIVSSIKDESVLINKCLDIARENGTNPGLCMWKSASYIVDSNNQQK